MSCTAGRAHTPDFDRIGRNVPLLVDLKPSGNNYMEDLYKAGGVPTLLRELGDLLHLDAMTITGSPLGAELDAYPASFPQDIVRPRSNPLAASASLVVLRGNLAPLGAVLKQSAMSPALKKHRGRAVVFKDADDLMARVDDPDLDVAPDSVLVLQNIGPVGHPGMPEAGYIPIPKKIARTGVKDMVRISDGRMSGTASGAVVLHVAPEAAVGGPLAVVQNGDWIELDVDERRIELVLHEGELEARLEQWKADKAKGKGKNRPSRGYAQLYHDKVVQADQGADFDFLRADGA